MQRFIPENLVLFRCSLKKGAVISKALTGKFSFYDAA